MTTSTDDILFEHRGRAGVITLNRPKALNAVTHAMLLALEKQLLAWEKDDAVERVIIRAVPGKAFSAGGDIRHLYERGIAGDPDYQFFADEYRINAYIKAYPKPYIALIDGIVMGGGVGVSVHGSHRIAGDNIAFAMPEVGIGFFPDVGGSYFLPRLPGKTGLYLGLTGSRIKTADCLWSGIATHYCPSDEMSDMEATLCDVQDMDEILASTDDQAGKAQSRSNLAGLASAIDQVFSVGSVSEIIDELKSMLTAGDVDLANWAQKCLNTMLAKSPTSLEIAFCQINNGKTKSMEDCMRMEYRILRRVLAGHEFYEGIRAAIIDKDNAPAWKPKTLDQVSIPRIEAMFAPLDPRGESEELLLP